MRDPGDRFYARPTVEAESAKRSGIFDFDNAVFKPLWKKLELKFKPKKALSQFNRYVKHHFSDHRPLWVELDTK